MIEGLFAAHRQEPVRKGDCLLGPGSPLHGGAQYEFDPAVQRFQSHLPDRPDPLVPKLTVGNLTPPARHSPPDRAIRARLTRER